MRLSMKKNSRIIDILHNFLQYRHAADGRHPVRRSRIYKGASRVQTPPVGGVAEIYARRGKVRGISLMELAICVLVLGVLTSGGISLYNSIQMQQKILVTHEHMDQIVNALSVYAESAGRVPCPGDPAAKDQTFGWEYGVTKGDLAVTGVQFPIGTCAKNNPPLANPSNAAFPTTVGIVPFMTLNLSDSVARDGWGHYFTFAVSPQYARSNDQSHDPAGAVYVPPQPNAAQLSAPPPVAGAAAGLVQAPPAPADIGLIHARCRTQGWVGRFEGNNISAVKARFCCNDQFTSQSPPGLVNGPMPYDEPQPITPGNPPTPGWSSAYSAGYASPTPVWNPVNFDSGTDLVIKYTDIATVLSPTRDAVSASFPAAAAPATTYGNYIGSTSTLPIITDLINPGSATLNPNPPIPGPYGGAYPRAFGVVGSVYETMSATILQTVPNSAVLANPPPPTTQLPMALPSKSAANPAGSNVLAPAMVLISHGPSGAGAFLGNNTGGVYNQPPAGTAKLCNTFGCGANKNTFIDGPITLAANFDDIVRWLTQDGLMAAHGALSCQYP
jgi:hypothetical protein